jgi:hypothetical protein
VGFAFGVLVEKMHFGPPLVMVALGGMTLALTAAALWRVIDPLTRPGGAPAAAPAESRRRRELDREKQLVLKAIKEIELDYQMRKIAEKDYREMVERYRARALRLIGEIEAGDDYRSLIERELAIRLKLPMPEAPKPAEQPTGAPVARAPQCPGCQTVNDEDALFCKKCGAKL